ncbi:phage portal protein [Janibacter melonis]|uniref:Phage portal protein n=1 Tax=Janibacter melonis TaxID=262209 RepID=A0A5P8FJI7_9MICO|nr:phage portal protein [Janibacter melonis]QFQ29719.2 phage portal protein [Janibacter melonis]
MTVEPVRVSGLSDDENRLANALLAQLDARAPRNRVRSDYYDGKRALRQLSAVMPGHYDNLGLVLGWAAKSVDALARRCHLDGFTWAEGDLDSLGLREFADDNMLLSELSGARVKAFTHGVSFLVGTTGGDGEPKALLHAKDALNGTGRWNSRTRRLDSFLSVTEREKDKVTGFVLYLDGLTIPVLKVDGRWVATDRHEHVYGVPVEPLIYKPQGRPFGYSRISRPIMGLQDAAVRALIRTEGHMDVYSWPEMVILGADGGAFQDEDGNTLAAWQAMLGRVKGIPDDEEQTDPSLARAEVLQFPAASPEPHLAQLNALAKMFAREASLPDSAVAITDMANPTSEGAYDASQYELVAEAEGAVDDFDRPIQRAIRRGLLMQNDLDEAPAAWSSISTQWRNPRFESRAQVADAGTKVVAAVPGLAETDVGLELMGLTPDQIRRFKGERKLAAGRSLVETLAPSKEAETAAELKARFDALGAAIRSGVSPNDAAARLGLPGIEFTGATPVSLRLPEADAAGLEEK